MAPGLPVRASAAAMGWAVAMALGAQVDVPMVPVPMSLQTLAVAGAGLVSGARVGALAASLYVLAALLGLPVLANGAQIGGLAFFAEPSIGYVLAFVPGAAVAGMGRGGGVGKGFVAACASHGVVLAVGGAVLAWHIGLGPAWAHGVAPFLLGGAVKSLLAAGLGVASRRREGTAPAG